MKHIETSLVHRVLLPEHPVAALHPTVVYLHGRGADEEDLLGLSGSLDERLMSISVRAPFPFEFGGYTWYDILELGKPGKEMFQSSYEKLASFLQDMLDVYPIDRRKLFLFGFSMGTVMSYALLLTRPELFAGIVANSGYLAEETYLTYRWHDMPDRDMFIAHGVLDPVIPVAAARRARFLFEQAGSRVTYKEYDMAHQISDASIADINAWLSPRIEDNRNKGHAAE